MAFEASRQYASLTIAKFRKNLILIEYLNIDFFCPQKVLIHSDFKYSININFFQISALVSDLYQRNTSHTSAGI